MEIEWDSIFEHLNSFKVSYESPSVSLIQEEGGSPYKILISTIISLRTRDEVTLSASRRLFEKADTPQSMLELNQKDIEKLIYPCGFFRVKSANILQISRSILNDHGGKVPDSKEALCAFPGVGLKTANLVLSLGFRIPAICVDIHVHRIANRMGWISTKNADASVSALEEILPIKYWISINELLVLYGQNVCMPRKAKCGECTLSEYCGKIGI